MAELINFNRVRATDTNDDPVAGALARFYLTGTTTPVTVYTTSALSVAHAVPLVADADGEFAPVWAAVTNVKAVVSDADDVELYTLDPAFRNGDEDTTAAGTAFTPTDDLAYTDVQSAIEGVFSQVSNTNVSSVDYIINGAFRFWLRGTSFSSANVYAADRWINSFTGGTCVFSQQSFTLGDNIGGVTPVFYARMAVAGQTDAAHFARFRQRIPDVRTYSGQTFTVLFWARRFAGAGNIAVRVAQNFGTGGSPSPDAAATPVSVAISGLWAPYAATFTMPTVAGKTLGTADDFIYLDIFLSAGSNFNSQSNSLGIQTITVDFFGVHTRLGTVDATATTLYREPQRTDEALRCRRFYATGVSRWDGQATSGVDFTTVNEFKVPMRTASPTIALTNTVNTSFPVTTSAVAVSAERFLEKRTADATGAGSFVSTWTADAEI